MLMAAPPAAPQMASRSGSYPLVAPVVENEGYDRHSLLLPGSQLDLIQVRSHRGMDFRFFFLFLEKCMGSSAGQPCLNCGRGSCSDCAAQKRLWGRRPARSALLRGVEGVPVLLQRDRPTALVRGQGAR